MNYFIVKESEREIRMIQKVVTLTQKIEMELNSPILNWQNPFLALLDKQNVELKLLA